MTDKNSEISLKEILLIVKEWVNYLFSKWIIILIFGVFGGVLGVLYAWISKPQYTASINFILANNSDNNSGLLNIASQFGINLSSGNNNAFTGNNIIALMKSRKMVQQALLRKPEGNKLSLLNIYCLDNELPEEWKDKERLKNVYPFPDSIEHMSPVQDSIFREIYEGVTQNYLTVVIPDKNQSIYNVTCTSENEIFSFCLTKDIVEVTSAFYIATKTKMAKSSLDMLQREADSLRYLLGGAITTAAAQTDETFNLNPAYQVQRSSSQKSQVQATVLGTAYGEVVKNLELAKITLQRETPLYQILDEPSLPLKIEAKSKKTYLVLGGLLSGIFVCTFLIIRHVFSKLK